MDEPDAVEEAIREMGVWLTRRYIHDPYPSETGTDLLAAIQQRYRNRRAGLSPTARTEIADAQAAFAVVWKWVSCGPKIAPDDVYEASGRVFRALDSVLGAESTKEAGNGR